MEIGPKKYKVKKRAKRNPYKKAAKKVRLCKSKRCKRVPKKLKGIDRIL